MSERNPFERLGDLIDQPVAPNARFAADLKAQLMSGLSTSDRSWEEEQQPVDMPYRLFPVVMPEQKRRIKPMMLIEVAAVAALLIGIAAAIASGLFSSDPDGPPAIPAAALQDESAATPADRMAPTVAPPAGTMEPTVASPAGVLWALPLPEGESLDFGGMTVHNGVIYRLLATPTFVGVEAVDSATGGVLWKQNANWDGFGGISADDNGVYYFAASGRLAGGIFVLSPDTGEQLWFADLPGTPRGQIADDGMLVTVDDGDTTTAIDTTDGSVAWQFVDSESDARTSQPDAVAVYGGALPVVTETTVFTFTTGGDAIAIDRATGEEIWREGGFHSVASHLALAGDVLVVMSAAWWHGKDATPVATPRDADVAEEGFEAVVNHVYGLSLADGSTLWEQYIAGSVQQPAVSGSTIAFIGVPSGLDENGPVMTLLEDEVSKNITGIDASNGEIVWTTPAGSNLYWQAYAVTDANGEGVGFVASSIDGITFWSESGEEQLLLSDDNHFGVSALASVNGVTVASLGDGTLVGIDTGQLSTAE